MKLGLIFVSALIAAFSIQAHGKAAHCEKLRTAPDIQRFSDGTILIKSVLLNRPQRTAEVQQKIKTAAPAGSAIRQRFDEAVRNLKQSMIEQVSIGSSGNSNSREYILNRLKNMSIEVVEDGCDEIPTNAAYMQVSNTLQVCPLVTHMPVEASLALLAHELGHLADPCNSPDVYRFSGALRVKGDISQTQVATSMRGCLRSSDAGQTNEFVEWASAESRRLSRELAIYPGDTQKREMADKLATCGLLVAPSIRAPQTYGQHPYLSLISCVSRTYPLAEDVGELNVPGKPPLIFASPLPITGSTRAGGEQACATERSSPQSQTREAVADHVGASLLNFHLHRVGNSIPESRRSLLPYWFENTDCEVGDIPEEQYLRSSERLNIFTAAMQEMGVPLAYPNRSVRCPVVNRPAALSVPAARSSPRSREAIQ